jgi:hypothetical protein
MKKIALSLTLVAALTFSFLFCEILVQPVRSQILERVYINLDGSVTGTDKIQRAGNVYTLTDNLHNLPIEVLRDNIIFDGGGFTLQGPGGYPTPAALNLSCTNVVVRNFTVEGWEVGILSAFNNNLITSNNLTGNERNIAVYADKCNITNNNLANAAYEFRIIGNNNIIFQNTIENSAFAFWITNSSGTIISANNITSSNPTVFTTDFSGFQVYHNNFVNTKDRTLILIAAKSPSTAILFPWDNGYPSGGNYWSDYASIEPNATEISNSGIGNIPYVVSTSPNVVDRYPLLSLVNISQAILELPLPTSSVSPSSSSNSPLPSASLMPSPSIPEFPLAIILPLFIVVVISFGLIVYNKKKQEEP